MRKDDIIPVYILDIDGYGQPSGIIYETTMSRSEYLEKKQRMFWIYDNYNHALQRALD